MTTAEKIALGVIGSYSIYVAYQVIKATTVGIGRLRHYYGGNSGYDGYSMSKRAAEAKSEGRFPKGQFRSYYDITAKSLDALVALDLISDKEWHHTSMYGNRTTFYKWADSDEDSPIIREIYRENKNEIDKAAREGNLPRIKNIFMQDEQAEGYVRYLLEMRFPYIEGGYHIKAVGGKIDLVWFTEKSGMESTTINDGEEILIDGTREDQPLIIRVPDTTTGFILNNKKFF